AHPHPAPPPPRRPRAPGPGCTWGIAGESLDGEIGWYCRYGTHYLSILDWEQVIRYREIHNL
ncbi:MAG: hypothetical protein K2P23_02415, partial [Lachnospiraceae bacterium]|nr:hypothetical protein [Lachnospiraceae bacterium]